MEIQLTKPQRSESNARKWGYVETPKGLFLLDYEACGPGGSETCLTDEGNKVDVPIYFKEEGIMSIMPGGLIPISAEDVKGMPKLGTENFGEFVRTFGNRLESNFHNWNRFLEKEIGSVGD